MGEGENKKKGLSPKEGIALLFILEFFNFPRSQGKWGKEAWIGFQVLYNPMVDCSHAGE
jgi:hypothetical protein